ncbi:MAG: matrixin family metalloprotease [Vicinamibacteria bacterium]|nr:matrixin family metalloprotease [Vicinamibacteria bacterium]
MPRLRIEKALDVSLRPTWSSMNNINRSILFAMALTSITAASGAPVRVLPDTPETPLAAPVSRTTAATPSMLPEVCYAPGTPEDVILRNMQRRSLLSGLQNPMFQFSDGSRWTTTATDGGGLTQGQVTTLTWNIVPDGTPIGALGGIAGESTSASNLRAFLDGIYGNEATWIAHFQAVFDRWSALTGVTYVKVNYDDSSSLANGNVSPFNPGALGVRADIRIGGHPLDGNFNVLAYNFYPNVGDMVIDTGDSYYSGGGLANGSLGFRNMLAHEHGHGLGFAHSCPINQTKLMEPTISTAYTHAQLDDQLAGWRGYGDDKENNETSATAANLGSLGNGVTTLTEVSIDDDADVDYYKFTVGAGKYAAVTLTPTGTTYLAGPQNGDGSCSAGTNFNALAVNDIGVELRATNGTTVLASANAFGAGVAENIAPTSLGGAGTYFIRAFGGAINSVQGYQLAVTISDQPVNASISDVAVTEGNAGTTNATFNVTLDAASASTVSLNYASADGTAMASTQTRSNVSAISILTSQTNATPYPSDIAVSGIAGNIAKATVTLNSFSHSWPRDVDVLLVGPGGQKIILMSDTGGTNATPASNVNLTLDATAAGFLPASSLTSGTFKPTDLSDGEGSDTWGAPAPAGPYTGTLTDLNGTSPNGTWSLYVTDDSTGDGGSFAGGWTLNLTIAGGDYTPVAGTLTFSPGQTAKTIVVPINGDVTVEANETFTVALSAPSPGLIIADGLGTGTIINDDGAVLPTLSINDVALTEGNAGTSNAIFTVSLSSASASVVTVSAATAANTATSPADFTATGPSTITFNAGETSKTFTVPVVGDTLDEINETFFVNLSSPTNATILDSQGLGTINDDDTAPSISIGDVAVTEGNAGTTNAVFTLSLSTVSGQTVTVSAATAANTAAAPADFTATGPTTITFNAGETTKTFTVPVAGDTLDEINETFFVNLNGPTNATLGDGQGLGTINDDDAAPSISIGDVAVTEGNAGTTNAVFTLSLSAASGQTVTVSAVTAANTAASPADFTATGPTTITFNAGETSKTFTVPVVGDTLDEINETFFVNLSSPTNVTLGDGQGLGTISDDDAPPTISINDVAVTEGNAGTTNATFTVSLSAASSLTITVSAATAANTATSPSDFTATGPTTLTFNPGITSQTFSVPVAGDGTFESNETFFVNLTGPTNATILDSQGIGTINNDDAAGAATLSINDATVSEGYLSGSTMTFQVSLSAPLGLPVTVNYATANGTAVAGTDYTTTNGILTFNPGDVLKPVTVPILGDAIFEPNETFTLNLSAPSGATIADGTGVGTILNDDLSTISVTNYAISEGTGAGTTNLAFTVVLSATSASTITVDYATANGSAAAGSDYTSTAGTLSFPPGAASLVVSVPVVRDAIVEPDETVLLNLSNATGATIFDSQGVGTIQADDGLLVSIADKTTGEGNAGFTPISFTVSLSSPAPGAVTVDYATADGTATAPGDYTAATGTVSFALGEQTKTVTVQVVGEALQEPYENFFVNLSNPTGGASIGDGQAQGTITNTDGATDRSRLMFHNFVTNRLYRWHMKNGNTLDTFNWVTPWATDPGWTVGAVADFDQDGQLDYLWHNVNDGRLLFWYIDGDNLKGFQFLPYVLDPGWSVATTLDANGDGAVDIVYYDTRTVAQSATSGNVRVFLHNNAVLLTSYALNQVLPVTGTTRVVNSVDANADGDDELVLYNSATGQVTAWDVTGATVGATITYPILQSTALAYSLVSTRTDFNNDGLPDLLWHNPTPTGVFSVWFMNGTARTGTGVFSPFTATDPVWKVVGSANVW